MSITLLASAALLATPGAMADLSGTDPAEQIASAPAPDEAAVPLVSSRIALPPVDPAGSAPPALSLDEIEQDEAAIVVSGQRAPRQDPMQAINQASYDAVQAVDDAVIAPLATGYRKALPGPVRTGLRNVLRNLTEPVIALNFLLQLKPGKAAETVGRFAVNSTAGIGGLLDVAVGRPINLPYRRNGFAYTLGYYGVGPGPYMFLPLVGPTTVRDVFGLTLDRFLLPFAVGGPLQHPAYVIGSFTIRSLDERVENDALFRRIREESNPYASYRELYLKTRQAEIDALKGQPVVLRDEVILPAIVPTPPPFVEVPPPVAPAPAAAGATVPDIVFVAEPVVQPLP
ncbi:MAG: VacJ family lipoprotein [Novosphingobium sp.]